MDAYMFNKRGYEKFRRGEFEEAMRDFNEAIRLVPNYSTAYHNLGMTKVELSDIQKDHSILFDGIKDLQTANKFDPGEGDYAI